MGGNIRRQFPIEGDGACMVCNTKIPESERLYCKACATPWHPICLLSPPNDMASCAHWECPDCSDLHPPPPPSPLHNLSSSSLSAPFNLVAAIRAIEADHSLTDMEKAKKRQQLLSGKANVHDDDEDHQVRDMNDDGVLRVFDDSLNCSFCMQLPDRPVSTPCGHNFCLKCFQKWIGQGKRTCVRCRHPIPPKMATQPRINSSLVYAIRIAKIKRSSTSSGTPKVYHQVHNQDRPDRAYTTERAKKTGKANAASGKIFVTIPSDFFGPITAEYDPIRNQGVLVGESWEDRLECRQWGAHFPHVAGIAGQSSYGAQSVALSGGYLDDEDHGEWFLYTGSGGRDLSGNKRTNKNQSFDQVFDKYNEALRVSCLKGYPIRVVRSHKEKRSSYAPEGGVRYDGIYRIEKCWRKVGIQGFKVCRYLFVRCDNEPAPWTSDERGDQPRPLPDIPELENATDIVERKKSPCWDYDESDGCWKWKKPPPASQKKWAPAGISGDARRAKISKTRKAQKLSVKEKLLKGFGCLICREVMNSPVTTPCGHNFCKLCLEGAFPDKAILTDRSRGGRTLRARRNVFNCPHCPADISDFLQDPKVNSDLMNLIESLKNKIDNDDPSEEDDDLEKDGDDDSLENDDEETKVSSEKGNDMYGATESCKVEAREGSNEDLQLRGERTSLKRKRASGEACSSQLGEGEARKSRNVQEAADEGEESPSSPLHVESVDN